MSETDVKAIFKALDRINQNAHAVAQEEGCQKGFNEFVEGIRILKLIHL